MITSDDTITMDGSAVYYRAPDITLFPSLNIETGKVTIEARARNSDTGADVGGIVIVVDFATINAETTTESDPTAMLYEACEKYVKAELESHNIDAIFTIV